MKELLEAYYKGFSQKRSWEDTIADDFAFPSGQQVNGNVAEIWTAKNGKLQSLAIYFDTLTFSNNTKP